MKESNIFGLIGFSLEHSFSPQYFHSKFNELGLQDYDYRLFPLESIEEFKDLNTENLKGLNVTIPYKQSIIKYLDDIEAEALEVGAVNTIQIKNGRCIGYNTDVYGFEQSLSSFLLDEISNVNALILGSGGASKAVSYVLQKLKMPYTIISRSSEWNYDRLRGETLESYRLIINTTPLGMSPYLNQMPQIDYSQIGTSHFLYDLIYNPEKTLFLEQGLKHGARIKNGLEMLKLQADKSWEIWNMI